METYFAPAGTVPAEQLKDQINQVNQHAIMSGLLHTISGVLAILNEQRQIVALNDSFLKMLGISDPGGQLGLRPGEALSCSFAEDEPGGCGTSRTCATCGAAIAIVSSLEKNKSVEKECALSIEKDNTKQDVSLLVRSHPIDIDDTRYLMLFLQDISLPQKRAALERTFFHDINNLLGGLLGTSQLLTLKQPSPVADQLLKTAERLYQEVAIQRSLMLSDSCCYLPQWGEVGLKEVFDDLESFFVKHPASVGKALSIDKQKAERVINSDSALLLRILCNMLINAFEATEYKGEVKLWVDDTDDQVSFCVWNAAEIPEDVRFRIFQRNFSTKGEAGRGIGTFSMKLFGEGVLGGKVSFDSSSEGTVFKLSL